MQEELARVLETVKVCLEATTISQTNRNMFGIEREIYECGTEKIQVGFNKVAEVRFNLAKILAIEAEVCLELKLTHGLKAFVSLLYRFMVLHKLLCDIRAD